MGIRPWHHRAVARSHTSRRSAPPGDLTAHARQVLLDSPGWLDYLRRIYAIDQQGYPFVTYVGINFTRERIKNYKFYFAFHRRLTPEEIAVVLPVEDRSHFDAMYAQWTPTRECRVLHRGTTFAIKVEADGDLTHYYHMRLPTMPFGPPQRLQLQPEEIHNWHGVCEEFRDGSAHLKRYYYGNHPLTVKESFRIGGMPDRTPTVYLLEYVESEGRDKVTWVTADSRLAYLLLHQQEQPALVEGVQAICKATNSRLFAPGSARGGGDHALYFYELADGPYEDGHVYDGVRDFVTKYLGLSL